MYCSLQQVSLTFVSLTHCQKQMDPGSQRKSTKLNLKGTCSRQYCLLQQVSSQKAVTRQHMTACSRISERCLASSATLGFYRNLKSVNHSLLAQLTSTHRCLESFLGDCTAHAFQCLRVQYPHPGLNHSTKAVRVGCRWAAMGGSEKKEKETTKGDGGH